MKEKILNWLNKNGLFTPQDKKEIKAATHDAGIEHTFRSGCPNCYTDAVTLLAIHYGVRLESPVTTCSGRYEYLQPSPSMWNGHVRLDATTPDFFIELFRASCPDQFAGFYREITNQNTETNEQISE